MINFPDFQRGLKRRGVSLFICPSLPKKCYYLAPRLPLNEIIEKTFSSLNGILSRAEAAPPQTRLPSRSDSEDEEQTIHAHEMIAIRHTASSVVLLYAQQRKACLCVFSGSNLLYLFPIIKSALLNNSAFFFFSLIYSNLSKNK